MTTVTLPPVTPAFARAVRELGCQLGWKRVARMIAYGPTQNETVAAHLLPLNTQAHKRERMYYGDQSYRYGLPGRNPPRNAAGGFKCAAPGGYQREWGDLIGAGTFRTDGTGSHKPGCKPISHQMIEDAEDRLDKQAAARKTTPA